MIWANIIFILIKVMVLSLNLILPILFLEQHYFPVHFNGMESLVDLMYTNKKEIIWILISFGI